MQWLIDLGYLGLLIGTFLAGTVFPLSSDVLFVSILTLGGNAWLCMLVASLGNWLGCMTSYLLGRLGKWEWLERWFNIRKEKLEKQKEVIDRYGVWIALFSWVPIAGTLSVVTLGFYKVKPRLTVLLLLVGCFARFLVWTLLYINYAEQFVNWITG